MSKLSLFSLIFLFTSKSVMATDQAYSVIIDKQAQQIKNLTSRLESVENAIFDLKTQLKAGVTPADTPPASTPTLGEHNADGSGIPLTAGTAISQDKREYDSALAALKDNKFEEAEVLFSQFIEKYPNSNLQSNAIFWYAETFFRRSIFNKSAINYLKGYKAFPKGSKAADSLLKLSFSLASLNKKQEACNMLDKLEIEFPNRPAASLKRAKDARGKFGCK